MMHTVPTQLQCCCSGSGGSRRRLSACAPADNSVLVLARACTRRDVVCEYDDDDA